MTSSSAVTRDAEPRGSVADRPRSLPPLAFRQVQLSRVGWMALLAPGAVAGLIVGLTDARGNLRAHRLVAACVAGAIAGVTFARVVDELRWRRSAICIELDEPDAVLDLLQAVRAQGVHADMIKAVDSPSATGFGYALRYRARDDRRVRALLAAQQS